MRTGINSVQTCGAYTGVLKALLFAYKFECNRAADTVLARILSPKVPALQEDMLITYVPTVDRHIRERGFDHAKLLAKSVAKQQRTIANPLLIRCVQTRQLGASRAVRMKNMTHAFEARPHATVRGKHVVLIDDVITTGATILSAARVLKDAGAARITVIAVARA
jgi:ComF family protein